MMTYSKPVADPKLTRFYVSDYLRITYGLTTGKLRVRVKSKGNYNSIKLS
jgi:putative lipoic acid-binding regulatory protein